jgi:alkylation response protein AidB-like acyl-CoA dehydrogenase
MAWDFSTEPEFQEELDWMRNFIDSEIIPLEPVMGTWTNEQMVTVREHLRQQVKDRGLWGAFLDEQLGGLGLGQLKLALMSEQIGRSMWSMVVFGVQAPDSGNMELLAHGANEEQKQRWLWPNYRGEVSSAFALTEPHNAGADPTKISTTATRDGDQWVLNGEKWMITNASVADFILVFAETDPEQRPYRHASIFVVPTDHPGLEIIRDIPTMGHPDTTYGQPGNHAYLRFNELRLADDHLIGNPGDGFALAQKRLGGGRIHHAMRWIGQAQRAFDIMCERAVSRDSHGKKIGSHQMIADYIATSHMELEAARLLTFRTAWRMDQVGAQAVRHELGMIKALVSRTVLDLLDRSIQVCGSLGYSTELPLESWYRSTRFGPIGDGPDEVHKAVLARTLLKNYTPADGWPTEHLPSRLPAAEAKLTELLAAASSPAPTGAEGQP